MNALALALMNAGRPVVGGQLPPGVAPSGSLTSYTPTMGERLVDTLRRRLFSDDRAGQDKAKKVSDALSFTPVGLAADMYDAGRSGAEGNYGGAALTLGMAGLPGPAPKGIRAFHGSPHDFDKFSMDRIGTGEGAQAYGHGLYFAEKEGVAKSYRDALSKQPFPDGDPANGAYYLLSSKGEDETRKLLSRSASPEEVETLIAKAKQAQSGRMYEVNINADPEQFLDWDKPLSAQPESIRNALVTPEADAMKRRLDEVVSEKALVASSRDPVTNRIADEGKWHSLAREAEELQAKMASAITPDIPGQLALYRMGGRQLSNPQATAKMREAGIPGIKYLDAGSRGAADGTRNYVLFDDSLIEILRKYGLAGLIPTGLGAAAAGQEQDQGGR